MFSFAHVFTRVYRRGGVKVLVNLEPVQFVTRDMVMRAVSLNPDYHRICREITGRQGKSDLAGDLMNEVVLAFYTMNEEKVQQAWIGNYVRPLFIRIATNLFNSRTSPFYKLYLHNDTSDELPELSTACFEDEREDHDSRKMQEETYQELAETVMSEISSEKHYDRILFEIYLREGSYKEVSRLTGIEYKSILRTVKSVQNKVKEKYYEQYRNLRVA